MTSAPLPLFDGLKTLNLTDFGGIKILVPLLSVEIM